MLAPRFRRIRGAMTNHTAFRDAPAASVNLADAARATISRTALLKLLRDLGVKCGRRCIRSLDRHSTLRSEAAALYIAAEHGTLVVFLVELTCDVTPPLVLDCVRLLRRAEPVRPILVVMAAVDYRTITFACHAADGSIRHFSFEPARLLPSDVDVLRDMTAAPGEPGVALAFRYAAAMDNKAVSARFFSEIRAQRDRIASAWLDIPASDKPERERLALLLLSRLMFLYFLQRQGHLCGDEGYLLRHVRAWQNDCANDSSLYRAVLMPLFFGVLNTRPERRTPEALALGPLPYLNGGLFERTAIECRFPDLDLPDPVAIGIFEDVLEKFRFTAAESSDSHASLRGMHIDPEMLGRVFEGLMSADRRGETGTFYTPPRMVDHVTARALSVHLSRNAGTPIDAAAALIESGDASGLTYDQIQSAAHVLKEVRVLDPACGSGAFLLGALSRVSAARVSLGDDGMAARRDVVSRCLHGVDLLDDAALLCSLRLWLALADTAAGEPPPLPNLDRRIRQGDSLLDPLELLTPAVHGGTDARALWDPDVRAALHVLGPLSRGYVDADPDERGRLQRLIHAVEKRLARAWVSALDRRLRHVLEDARARAAARDLWGELGDDAVAASRVITRTESRLLDTADLRAKIEDSTGLPFFSFRVHFADRPAFNLILSNPPWVRSHNWPAIVGAAVRERYEVCRAAGWSGASDGPARKGGQIDLAVLFLERSVKLLEANGTLGILLPAKVLRSLYAGTARAFLHRTCSLASIDDHSLDQRSVFRADAFTAVVVASKRSEPAQPHEPVQPYEPDPPLAVRMHRRGVAPLEFQMPADDLPLIHGENAAPWLIVPPSVRTALRKMQGAGSPIARQPVLAVRRGIVTGANDVLLVREFSHKLGGLTHIRADGFFHHRNLSHSTALSRRFVAHVETEALRPLLRGADIRAWSAAASSRIVWVPERAAGKRVTVHSPHMDKYLARHDLALGARRGVKPGHRIGAISGISEATVGHKVVWRDIADTLCAAAVPDTVRGDYGRPVPVIPLNTVYFLSVPDADMALLITAYLNSLPMRVFARAVAERAKDAHFRFFAWTVGSLPLPLRWQTSHAEELNELSRSAHALKGLTAVAQARLDALVCTAFGLSDADVEALLEFDRWLSGVL